MTLFASGGSETRAKLSYVYAEAPLDAIGRTSEELRHVLACFARAGDFDVINDHTGPLGVALAGTVATPVVHTVHGPLGDPEGEIYTRAVAVSPQVRLISLSIRQRLPAPDLPWIANCPNAVDLSAYPFAADRGDYLLFLGRFSPEKGCHRAIEVARAAGIPLKIAGKKHEPDEQEYFEAFVRPKLGDGIEYVGEATHDEKVLLLQNARAVLFPIEWDEPFGLVMLEAMACGTPVIATRRGAVPEVLAHQRTGIIVDDYREMVEAVEATDELDPRECRRYVEEWFSPERMVQNYDDAFARASAGQPQHGSDVPQ